MSQKLSNLQQIYQKIMDRQNMVKQRPTVLVCALATNSKGIQSQVYKLQASTVAT